MIKLIKTILTYDPHFTNSIAYNVTHSVYRKWIVTHFDLYIRSLPLIVTVTLYTVHMDRRVRARF